MAPEDRRAELLQVAREVFSRQSYAAVSLADVARAAQVTPPLLTFYFGTKSSLYTEVIRTAVAEIGAGLLDLPGPPSLERLQQSVRFYAEHARSHRASFLSLLRGGAEGALPEASELVESLRGEISAWIMKDLEVSADGVDRTITLVAVRGYLGYVDSAIAHWLALPEEEQARVGPDTIAQLAVGAFTGGLAAAGHPAPDHA